MSRVPTTRLDRSLGIPPLGMLTAKQNMGPRDTRISCEVFEVATRSTYRTITPVGRCVSWRGATRTGGWEVPFEQTRRCVR